VAAGKFIGNWGDADQLRRGKQMKNCFILPPSYYCQKNAGSIVFHDYYNNILTMDFDGNIVDIQNLNEQQHYYYHSFYFVDGDVYAFPRNKPVLMKNYAEQMFSFKEAEAMSSVRVTGKCENGMFVLYSDGSLFSNIDVTAGTYKYRCFFDSSEAKTTVCMKNSIFFQDNDANLLEYDVLEDVWRKTDFVQPVGTIQHICAVDNGLFALKNESNEIIGFEKNGKIVFKCRLGLPGTCSWNRIHSLGNKLLLLPFNKTTTIFEIDSSNLLHMGQAGVLARTFDPQIQYESLLSYLDVRENKCISDLKLLRTYQYMFSRYYEDDDCVIYPNRGTYAFMYMDKKRSKIEWIYPKLREPGAYWDILRGQIKGEILEEEYRFGLKEYIGMMLRG